MAGAHARAFKAIPNCSMLAACDIDAKRVADYAREHAIPDAYTELEKVLIRKDIDAVSLVVPDSLHHPLGLKVLAAGKHLLCEKPLALNHAQAVEMRDAAARAGVIHMVNFSYRNSSAIQRASELVEAGVLGTVRHVRAHYHQSWLVQDAWGDSRSKPGFLWRQSKSHGSTGVLGDVGVHLLDFASMPLGAYKSVYCRLKNFKKNPENAVGEYTLDANDTALITAEFSNGALGTLDLTRWAYPHINQVQLRLYGDQASIVIDLDSSYTCLKISRILGRQIMDWETLDCGETPTNYARFIRAIESGVADQPDFARAAEIQAVLDACFESDAKDRTIHL